MASANCAQFTCPIATPHVQITIPAASNSASNASAVTVVRRPARKIMLAGQFPTPRTTLMPGSVVLRAGPQATYQYQPLVPVLAAATAVRPAAPPNVVPKRVTKVSAGPSEDSSNHSADLIEVFAERLDLLAKMQLTRAAVDESAKLVKPVLTDEMHKSALENERCANGGQYAEGGQYEGFDGVYGCAHRENESDMPSPTTTVAIDQHCPANPQVNNELLEQMRDQNMCISKLTGEVEALRSQLVSMGAAPLASTSTSTGDTGDSVPPELFHEEAEQLSTEDHPQEGRRTIHEGAEELPMSGYAAEAGYPLGNDQPEYNIPRYNIPVAYSGNEFDADLMSVTQPVPRVDFNTDLMSATQFVPLVDRLGIRLCDEGLTQPPSYTLKCHRGVAPWNRAICGVNVEISEDGFTVTRTRGCRQAVAVGIAPLELKSFGKYFEIEVLETVDGWVGGLGIGVTTSPPESVRRMPDKAWRMPGTFVAGYGGSTYMDGIDSKTSWKPDVLSAGSRIGVLIPCGSVAEMLVFVDGILVVRSENTQLMSHATVFPVVDVFAATRVVRLLPDALPWGVENSASNADTVPYRWVSDGYVRSSIH